MTASALTEGGPEARVERTFPALDGARAVAATAVVLTHVSFWTGNYSENLLGRSLNRLEVGVAIFFVLSGFLLSRPLFLAAAEGRPAPRTAAYLWRRGLRILPPYWLAMTAGLLLFPAAGGHDAVDWLRHAVLGQVYVGPFGEALTHTWSLCTEVAFYLVLPWLAAGLVRLGGRDAWRPARLLAGLAVLTAAGIAWQVLAPGRIPGAVNLWLPAHLGWFAAGMALAVVSVSPPSHRLVRVATQIGADVWTCWAGALALFLISASPITGPAVLSTLTTSEALLRHLLYLGVGLLFVWPLVFGDQSTGAARRALSGPTGRFLGEISYGIFLFHLLVLVAAYTHWLPWPQFTGPMPVVFALVWGGGVVVATLVYVLVERPLRRWRRLVADRSRTTGELSRATTTEARATSARV